MGPTSTIRAKIQGMLDWIAVAALIAPLLGVLVALIGIRREKDDLRLLERVVALLEKMPVDSSARKPFDVLQADLTARVFSRYVDRRNSSASRFASAISVFMFAFLLISLGILSRVTPSSPVHGLEPTMLITGSVLLLIGLGLYLWALSHLRMRIKSRGETSRLFREAGYWAAPAEKCATGEPDSNTESSTTGAAPRQAHAGAKRAVKVKP